MKCPLVYIAMESQDCLEDKCYFWEIKNGKCKWMSIKRK
jgi:hypothetical protein